ncbi:MAG: HEPN domain-containing protein [Candidatus Sericytochromatia bacterium]|nr:HEPN domain-containing protein [Candidatus Sericytochromatia bacterium]
MTIDASLWFEKAQLAGQASRRELDAGNLPAAANRAYFSLYPFLTGLLIQRGHTPPADRGHWPHSRMHALVRTHLRASYQKHLSMALLNRLYRYRSLADYGDHRLLDAATLSGVLRQLGTVIGSQWRG